jgi:adenylate cyclase
MDKPKGFMRRLVSLSPFKISFIIMILFLFMFVAKERGRGTGTFQTPELIELKAYDLRFQALYRLDKTGLFGTWFRQTPSDKIVIAEIDDRAVAKWQWPFPRDKWAEFINRMNEYGAKVVAFDVVFDNPGGYEGLQFINEAIAEYEHLGISDLPPEIVEQAKKGDRKAKEYQQKVLQFQQYIKNKQTEADPDLKFAAELEKMRGRVVLGWYGYQSKHEVAVLPDKDFSDNAQLINSRLVVFYPVKGATLENVLFRLKPVRLLGLNTNIPILSHASDYFGFFTSEPEDLDGTLRRTPLLGIFTFDEKNPTADNTFIYQSLSLAAISSFYGESPVAYISPVGVEKIEVGQRTVQTDERGKILVNWMGPSTYWDGNAALRTYPYYSIYDIITGFQDQDLGKDRVDPHKVFKDKIVLVGSTTIGAHDLRTTPFGTSPGVELHANVISNILKGDSLVKPEWFKMFDLLLILFVGILFGLILPRVSAVWGGVASLALFLGYIAMNVYFFEVKHYCFTIVFPLAEILFIYIGVTIYRYATEEKEKRFIKGAFSHYLSPAVIDQLVKDPSKLNLGGVRKEMTAFFSDIQSFSSFSEKMQPEQLVHFLNIYLTEMCDIILSYDGTIDKFEGDAIIAFFGAPLDVPDHAAKACLCAAEIQKKMVEYRKQWIEQGWPEVHMRIGLNTGAMVVGNMGSKDRMDYTIMGDAVNLASRLESGAKQYKIYLMISEDTRNEAGDVIEVRELDAIRVKGKEQPVKVFELLGKKGEVDPKKREAAKLFEKGLAMYRQRYWSQAVEQFKKALELVPNDGPSLVFLDRCEEYSENPPGSGWDGVYTMTSK